MQPYELRVTVELVRSDGFVSEEKVCLSEIEYDGCEALAEDSFLGDVEEAIDDILDDSRMYLEDPDDPEPQGPEDGDYLIFNAGTLGSRTGVAIHGGKFLGMFADDDTAERTIRGRMAHEKFWPNVWRLDDHGGYSLLLVPEATA